MKLNLDLRDIRYIQWICEFANDVCDADKYENIYSVWKKVQNAKDSIDLDDEEAKVLRDWLKFQDKCVDHNMDLLARLHKRRSLSTELGSMLNDKISGVHPDIREDAAFWDKIMPVINALTSMYFTGDTWESPNEEYIQFIYWLSMQGTPMEPFVKWWHAVEKLLCGTRNSDDAFTERGDITEFNAAVAQE